MGSSKKPKMEVTEYRLSMHVGICVGPIDEIKAIYIDEKIMWTGSAKANAVLDINKPGLFGGVKEEGGVSGQCHVLMGGNGQVLSPWLQGKLTGLEGVPGFRGLLSLFFTGRPGERKGFYWTANSPYIKDVWVKASHVPGGLSPTYVNMPNGTVNPAHVIYEAMTRAELGMGEPTSRFDQVSFNAAAKTLWEEGIGVAFAWTGQTPVEQIVQDMQDHVDAWVFQHPRTGLWTMKLVRGDYNPASLKTITPDVAILDNFQRKGMGETVNEIVVTYTNPGNEKEETVVAHDLGNIAAQGALVSDSRNYYAIRSPDVAAMLAQRDIRVASTPLCACDAVLNRRFWDLVPGDVVKLTWPDYGLKELVMRVGKVDYGLPGNQAIKASLVEDVFAIPTGNYVVPPSTGWVDPSLPPRPVPAHLSTVVTLPAYMIANLFGTEIEDVEYPEVRSGVLVTQDDNDTFYYGLLSRLSGPSGNLEWLDMGTRATLGYGYLDDVLVRESVSHGVKLNPLYGTTEPDINVFIWIGNPSNFNETTSNQYSRAELCLISAGESETGWTIMRGVLDTQPLDWEPDTPFWVIDPEVDFDDGDSVRAAGENAQYKALPITSQGVIDIEQSPTFSRNLSGRPHLPLRPADVRLNNTPWGKNLVLNPLSPLVFTWADRNRLTETALVLKWDDNPVTPEPGTEIVVRLFDGQPGGTAALTRRSETSPIEFTSSEVMGIPMSGKLGWSVSSVRGEFSSFSTISGVLGATVEPAVIFVRAGTQTRGNSSLNLSIQLPSMSDVVLDDSALFVTLMHRGDVTPPPGWLLVASELNPPSGAVTTQKTSVYMKSSLDPSDSGATTTWTQSILDRFIGQSVLFTNAKEGYGVSVGQISTGTSSTSSIDAPLVTSDGTGQCVLMTASSALSSTSSTARMTSPSGTTQISPEQVANNRLCSAYKPLSEGESTSGTFTGNNTGAMSAISILLLPESGSTVGYGQSYGTSYGI